VTLADQLQALRPVVQRSPLAGFEYVKGFGVFGLPFDSGHVLALRVFPENDFGPYVTLWHRTPDGAWTIFVDGARPETACPRYYGPATREVRRAKITLAWTGASALRVTMDDPKLEWSLSMSAPWHFRLMNAMGALLPRRLWLSPVMQRVFEWMARRVFGLGRVTLSGTMPSGHFGILMPKRMFPITVSTAVLDRVDMGTPTRGAENPTIGAVRLPARGVFAVGQGYFRILDPAEYERTVAALPSNAGQ
jgi:hypothetical protein